MAAGALGGGRRGRSKYRAEHHDGDDNAEYPLERIFLHFCILLSQAHMCNRKIIHYFYKNVNNLFIPFFDTQYPVTPMDKIERSVI